jgi:hypothetical protein
LAEKITDPANPLTSRVIVNRVWAWHFGAPLADPGDFGPQESAPPLLPLLDDLALRFEASGRSLKQLHRLLLTSRSFRLAADGPAENNTIDQANTRFWKWNRRRVDFEAMRDRLLATAGTLDTTQTGGRSVSLENEAADRRRSLYAFVDRYALPTTFVSFDLPHPDHHSPKRNETTVPQQALWWLNSPLVLRQAAKLAASPDFKALPDDRARVSCNLSTPAPAPAERRRNRDDPEMAGPGGSRRLPTAAFRSLGNPPRPGQRRSAGRRVAISAVCRWRLENRAGSRDRTDPLAPRRCFRWPRRRRHTLVLRWRALGNGQARIAGNIHRTQKGGADLEWNLASPQGENINRFGARRRRQGQRRRPMDRCEGRRHLDFILRAPHGDTCGGFAWNFRIEGRESADAEVSEIAASARTVSHQRQPTPAPLRGDPWADLIQMLWSSNEFHFID